MAREDYGDGSAPAIARTAAAKIQSMFGKPASGPIGQAGNLETGFPHSSITPDVEPASGQPSYRVTPGPRGY